VRADVLGLVVCTRISFLILTYLGIVLIHDARIFGTPRVSFALPLMDHWFHWDSMWYINIARHGYVWSGWGGQSPTAHFPLYSLLIRDLGLITGLPDKLVAIGLANLCYTASMLVLYNLCHREFGDPAVAWRTVLYLSLFPTALFFFAPYSESLFLLLTVSAFSALRRGQWWVAGLWAGLAALTRVPGVLLTLPLAWDYLAARGWRLRRVRADALSLLIAPAALGGYMVALAALTGDPFAFIHHASDWQRAPAWPWQALAGSVSALHTAAANSFFQAHNLVELCGVGLFITMLAAGARTLPPAYTIYGVAALVLVLITPTSTDLPLTSVSRYLAAIFPAFMTLAVVGRRPLIHTLYISTAPGLLALFTVIYLNGGWVA